MKKAKVMLMAIAILGTVGGVLAFKSHKAFIGDLRCNITTTAITTDCPIVTYTASLSGFKAYCTAIDAPSTALCTPTSVLFSE